MSGLILILGTIGVVGTLAEFMFLTVMRIKAGSLEQIQLIDMARIRTLGALLLISGLTIVSLHLFGL